MKLLFAGLIAASTLSIAAPAMAQSVYIGPNGGVGIGIGARPYGYDRGREFYGDRGPRYEGRSAYRGDRGYGRDGGDRPFRRDRY